MIRKVLYFSFEYTGRKKFPYFYNVLGHEMIHFSFLERFLKAPAYGQIMPIFLCANIWDDSHAGSA